jgi:hypothetical protein
MGFVVGYLAIAAFFVSAGIGACAVYLHFVIGRLWKRGSWPLYFAIACTIAVAVTLLPGLFFEDDGPGAPTSEDYARTILWAVIAAISPGLGLVCGLVALFKRCKQRS